MLCSIFTLVSLGHHLWMALDHMANGQHKADYTDIGYFLSSSQEAKAYSKHLLNTGVLC